MHVFAMTIEHRYSSKTFLAVTVQSKVAVVKLLKHARKLYLKLYLNVSACFPKPS